MFPNIESSDVEIQERVNYVQEQLLKYGAGIVDRPYSMANAQEMDAIHASSVAGNVQYTAGFLEAADRLGLKPSELYNANRQATNVAMGENKPLLGVTPSTTLMDEADSKIRKLFASGDPSKIRRGGAQMSGRVANAVRPSMVRAYTSGNIGPTSTGPHLDVKRVDGGRFEPNALDEYVVVDDPEFGQVSLGQIRELTNNVGDNFDEHVARGSHGIDYGLESGTEIFLKNGASVVSSEPTEHGDYVVIELPNGDRYSFLHGKR